MRGRDSVDVLYKFHLFLVQADAVDAVFNVIVIVVRPFKNIILLGRWSCNEKYLLKPPKRSESLCLPEGMVRSFLMPRSPVRFPGEVEAVEEADRVGIGTVAAAAMDCRLLPPRFLRRPCRANGIPDLMASILSPLPGFLRMFPEEWKAFEPPDKSWPDRCFCCCCTFVRRCQLGKLGSMVDDDDAAALAPTAASEGFFVASSPSSTGAGRFQ